MVYEKEGIRNLGPDLPLPFTPSGFSLQKWNPFSHAPYLPSRPTLCPLSSGLIHSFLTGPSLFLSPYHLLSTRTKVMVGHPLLKNLQQLPFLTQSRVLTKACEALQGPLLNLGISSPFPSSAPATPASMLFLEQAEFASLRP